KPDQRMLLEVGPGQTLSMLVRRQAKGRAAQSVCSTLRHASQTTTGSDVASAITTLGRLWLSGVDVAWSDFYSGETRHRVLLPTYPFQRQRFWVNPVARRGAAPAREEKNAGKIHDVRRWF